MKRLIFMTLLVLGFMILEIPAEHLARSDDAPALTLALGDLLQSPEVSDASALGASQLALELAETTKLELVGGDMSKDLPNPFAALFISAYLTFSLTRTNYRGKNSRRRNTIDAKSFYPWKTEVFLT